METVSEKVERHGIVVEEQLGGCECSLMTAFPSSDMGGFNDLTDGMKPGQASRWDEFDAGCCPKCGGVVRYRQMLIVTHVTTVRVEVEYA
jgi:hypothetical protein